MAPDERDRSFDKALARYLRSAAASSEAANLSAGSASQGGTCPDSEILAAYHERSLLPQEMNSWKEHIVSCANCQTVLTQLEATDEILLQATEEEGVFASKESEPALAARRVETSLDAAPSDTLRAAGAALPAKSRRARLLRGARWQWLAPAGAIAAGLLVWIALHENQPLPLPSTAEIKIAAKEPAPSPPPSGRPALAMPRIAANSPKPQTALEDRSVSNARAESDSFKQRQKGEFGAIAPPAKRDTEKESGTRKDAALDAPADLLHDAKPGDLDSKAVAGAAQEKVELQAQASNVQSQNQANAYLSRVPGPSPLNQAETTKKMKAAASPPPAPAGDAASSYAVGAVTETVMVSDSRLINAPGSSFVWRTGRAGLIDFSKNAGRSWVRQPSGVLVDLQTGSAPTDKICWIVGRVGAVLLTTDGGAHWKLLAPPLGEDLGGVHASDALHATVWNVRNTKSFQTSDGGLTWKRVANE